MPDNIVIFTKEELENMLNGQIIVSQTKDGRVIRYMSKDQYEAETTPAMDWEKAKNHLNEVIANYISIGWTGQLALNYNLLPLRERYNKGERTRQLYDDIMECE